MEQSYKGHGIEVSVWRDGDGWFASLFIYYSEGLHNILVTFAMPDTFKTYDGAIEAGFRGAQKGEEGGVHRAFVKPKPKAKAPPRSLRAAGSRFTRRRHPPFDPL